MILLKYKSPTIKHFEPPLALRLVLEGHFNLKTILTSDQSEANNCVDGSGFNPYLRVRLLGSYHSPLLELFIE